MTPLTVGKDIIANSNLSSLPGNGEIIDFLQYRNAEMEALSKEYRLPIVDLDHYKPDEKAVSKVSEDLMRRFLLFPLFQIKQQLYVATATPGDPLYREFLWHLTGLNIEQVLATREAIERNINHYFLTQEKTRETFQAFSKENMPVISGEETQLQLGDENAPAIKMVQYIISQAIKLGASDIHLEAFEDTAMLRYRVDGVLHEVPPPPAHLFHSLVSRIKIISNLDIAERRLPQDGRATFSMNDRDYDLRVSVIPNIYGEGVVVRILDTKNTAMELNGLGVPVSLLARYEHLIQMPYGIVLVTGPTGSGKTTTLYATLKRIYKPEKKIITLEDPVEYKLRGVTQIQVHPDIGLTFAAGLRSILRHDPDVVMLGEIRDLESAEIAIRASLTGHLVLSTLHTNDAVSAVTRLLDMGIPNYLIFSSLLGVVAQRLVRRLCSECKVPVTPDDATLQSLNITAIPEGAVLYSAKGCPACENMGYKGREGIFELLEVTHKLKRLPQRDISPETIKKILAGKGFISMRDNALQKLFSGLTSTEEVLNLTMEW